MKFVNMHSGIVTHIRMSTYVWLFLYKIQNTKLALCESEKNKKTNFKNKWNQEI